MGIGNHRPRRSGANVSASAAACSLVSVAEDRRFELLRLAPNALSDNAGQRSPASATVRELRKHDPRDHR